MEKGNKKNFDYSVLAIGWDVRGWLGKKQAIAIVKLKPAVAELKSKWWVSDDFKFTQDEPLCLSSLIKPALGEDYQSILKDTDQIIIGIDAPLAFPRALKDLLNDAAADFVPAGREIENLLAYRDCERWVYQVHGKKPLSAPFDKLGNGATLAMAMCNGLRREGFSVLPQDENQKKNSVIEVYPGIVKQESKRVSQAVDLIHRLMPDKYRPGTDQYDAAICAIVAAVYAGAGSYFGLPDLVGFQSGYDCSEGWVYSFSAEFIESRR